MWHVADEYMMNVKLRPAPTRVNAILGCPYVIVRNGYGIPIFFLWNRLPKKLVWLSCVRGGRGAGVVYVARIVAITVVVYFQLGCHTPVMFNKLYLSSK